MTNEFISIQDAADISNKSIQTIRRAIKARKLKTKKKNTPQGFNYLVSQESLTSLYGVVFDTKKTSAATENKETPKKIVKKAEDNTEFVKMDDLRSFTSTLEKMLTQNNEERQNFLRLVNTLQEKIFVLENQLNLLQAPKKKWFNVFK